MTILEWLDFLSSKFELLSSNLSLFLPIQTGIKITSITASWLWIPRDQRSTMHSPRSKLSSEHEPKQTLDQRHSQRSFLWREEGQPIGS